MPALAACEAAGATHGLRADDGKAAGEFLAQRLIEREPVLPTGRGAVRAHAGLREAGDLMGERFRLCARPAVRDDVLAEPDTQGLLGRDLAPGQDDLERPPQADEARQAHRAAVDERYAPALAVDAEIGVLGHDPEVAPECELGAACDRRP